MANLTLSLDEELLRAARVKAAQQGTSVNEIFRRAIAELSGFSDDPAELLRRLQAVAARKPTPGNVGRRADWHDESGRLRRGPSPTPTSSPAPCWPTTPSSRRSRSACWPVSTVRGR